MKRKTFTERFPFLLPVRKLQRNLFFYTKMHFDENKYSLEKEELLKFKIFTTKTDMINKDSGFPIEYQINKVHNLKLASKNINRVIIKPNEMFSFWKLVRGADKHEKYKDGLSLIDGEIVGSYGGGLCQLSNMLFLMFLNTPLTIVERHSHRVQKIPARESVIGIDSSVAEGWLDLKVRNDTQINFQIDIEFDKEYMYGSIYSDTESRLCYEIYNMDVEYIKNGDQIVEKSKVYKKTTDKINKQVQVEFLYENKTEIGYKLPNYIEKIERGA